MEQQLLLSFPSGESTQLQQLCAPPVPSGGKDSFRVCSKCNRRLPNTHQYFWKNCYTSHGLHWWCRECCGSRFLPPDGYKECSRCHKVLLLSTIHFFRRNGSTDGYGSYCKACATKAKRASWERHGDKYKKNGREYSNRPDVKERARRQRREWRASRRDDPEYIEKQREYSRQYWPKRMERPNSKIRHNLKNRVLLVLKGITKSKPTLKLIGCSIPALKRHLEQQWQEGMSWGNYGHKGGDYINCWHIDHIRPCASFDLSDPAQQRECFHYTNLQPLWATENRLKGDKWEPLDTTKESASQK